MKLDNVLTLILKLRQTSKLLLQLTRQTENVERIWGAGQHFKFGHKIGTSWGMGDGGVRDFNFELKEPECV